jgi:hypothetical protein
MKEPWCLATSLSGKTAAEIVKLYGRRFTIEETFRDTKDIRFGLGLSAMHIDRTDRSDRLLFLFAIAHARLMLLGAAPALAFDNAIHEKLDEDGLNGGHIGVHRVPLENVDHVFRAEVPLADELGDHDAHRVLELGAAHHAAYLSSIRAVLNSSKKGHQVTAFAALRLSSRFVRKLYRRTPYVAVRSTRLRSLSPSKTCHPFS